MEIKDEDLKMVTGGGTLGSDVLGFNPPAGVNFFCPTGTSGLCVVQDTRNGKNTFSSYASVQDAINAWT